MSEPTHFPRQSPIAPQARRRPKQHPSLGRRLAAAVPAITWLRHYDRADLSGDLLAAVIVTIMLIPQSLAYAILAGLPPEAGLYASILPIMVYALFGTSRQLAVGPVAVVSLLTAEAVGDVALQGTAGYATAALVLAGLSGAILLGLGLLRLGVLANFLSHSVISGFITASGLLIAGGQIGSLLGIKLRAPTLPGLMQGLWDQLDRINPVTTAIGVLAVLFLVWVRKDMKRRLRALGLGPALADALTKAGPVLAVAVSTTAVWGLGLDAKGVSIVGTVPQGLPPFAMPAVTWTLIEELALPALLIAIIGFVESVSVAQTLAARQRQRISPDQELIGLGMANMASSLTGGMPVTGGFSRSVVNADAGARTPAAGAFTALGLGAATLALTPLLFFLPKATLAATIMVAVLALVDLPVLARAWRFSRQDFAAIAVTIAITLAFGVEHGVMAGVALSLGLHLLRSARPHVAEIGLVPGTEHFRNLLRYDVDTDPRLLMLRPDESLYFANTRHLEEVILDAVAERDRLEHVVLMCSAVNEIDMTALETLEQLSETLAAQDIRLHLSEVKGPVMDRLRATSFLDRLSGQVFLTQYDAFKSLAAH